MIKEVIMIKKLKSEKIKKDNYLLNKAEFFESIRKDKLNYREFKNSVSNDTALLILDMQDYFLENDSHAYIPASKSIISPILKLSEKFLSNNMNVFLTKHINNYLNAGMMARWWKEIIDDSNRYSEISSYFSEMKVPVIEKSQYDAFYDTVLAGILSDKHIKRIVITGVITHICCETTARAAFVRGYEVVFPADGSADYNYQYHIASLRNLYHSFAYFTTMDGLIESV